MGVHYEIIAQDDLGNDWLVHTTDKVEVGAKMNLFIEPDAIHVMRRSDVPLFSEQEEEQEEGEPV